MMNVNDIIIPTNQYLTPITKDLIDKLPLEVLEQFLDFINNVPYIRALISPNRPYPKDCPRDVEGKIIIDLTNPPILTNMDYFRPTAIHYLQTGKISDLRPNPNPNSEYGKWVREEVRRCLDGYVREEDGLWITGDMYFFLNYCPILLSKVVEGKKALRIWDFPEVWEGHFLKFHYINIARNNGHHGAELASRSKGKSFSLAAMIAKRFLLGENRLTTKEVKCLVTAYLKEFLTKDGILNKFQSYIDFCALNTQFPSRKLRASLQDMNWKMGYIDLDTGSQRGTLNEVIGVSSKDDESKLRGKRGVLIAVEEFGSFPNLLGLYGTLRPSVEEGDIVFGLIFLQGCVCAGTKVWTMDGRNINIEDIKKEDGIIGCNRLGVTREAIGTLITPATKHCYRITTSNGNTLECSEDHPILVQKKISHRCGKKRIYSFIEGMLPTNKLKIGDRICEAREINVFGTDTLFDARLVGMLIGDGSYGFDNTPKYSSEDKELLDYVKSKYDWGLSATHITKKGNIYEDIRVKGICPKLREIGIYGLTRDKKRLPINYQTLTYEDTVNLLGGLFDTDGSVNAANQSIDLTQANKEILNQVTLLLRKLGIICSIVTNKPDIREGSKDKNPWYSLKIAGRHNILNFHKHITLKVNYKQEALNRAALYFNQTPSQKPAGYDTSLFIVSKITKIEDLGNRTIYNMSAANTHTYLANNIITHNTAGDDESDFAAAQEIMYNPLGYNMLEIYNVYDKEGLGRKYFVYFFPGYLNRKGCYNKDGVSDVVKALIEILLNRYKVKYNSTDINAITKTITEVPITPLEAILRSNKNIFPITELNSRLNEIDNNPAFYNDTYVGTLTLTKEGIIEFKPTGDLPIRDFPTKDNKVSGALEIYEMPLKVLGKIPLERYIIGLDNYENDISNTMSLGSMFVLDLWTDRIVAEYTGRPMFVDDLNELCRKLCIFYNARCLYENNKKNTFAYFSKMNCLHLLADTPEYLKLKQLIKTTGYGNTAKGTAASVPIKNFGFTCIRDWLLKPVTTIQKIDGVDLEVTVPNLHFLKNRALIKELILFNPDINVDRIMSLVLVMLYREEKVIMYQGDMHRDTTKIEADYAGNDEFFSKNYDSKFSKTSYSF